MGEVFRDVRTPKRILRRKHGFNSQPNCNIYTCTLVNSFMLRFVFYSFVHPYLGRLFLFFFFTTMSTTQVVFRFHRNARSLLKKQKTKILMHQVAKSRSVGWDKTTDVGNTKNMRDTCRDTNKTKISSFFF